jgi:cytidine deaminase
LFYRAQLSTSPARRQEEENVARQRATVLAERMAQMGLTNSWRIARGEREALEALTNLDTVSLLHALVPLAQAGAIVPISNYPVGCALLGRAGHVYLGANLEIADEAIGFSLHAEQSAVSNAMLAGEELGGLAAIAVTAQPCGHCRQFLRETQRGRELRVFVGDELNTLDELLPVSFGPADLGNESPLLAHKALRLRAAGPAQRLLEGKAAGQSQGQNQGRGAPEGAAALKAVVAAGRSYAPYTGAHAAIVLQLRDGTLVEGLYAENAAFNPSLPPMVSALDHLRLRHVRDVAGEVVHAVFAERQSSRHMTHRHTTANLLRAVAPDASLDYLPLELLPEE